MRSAGFWRWDRAISVVLVACCLAFGASVAQAQRQETFDPKKDKEQPPPKEKLKREGKDLFNQPSKKGGGDARVSAGWSVVIVAIRGGGDEQPAQAAAALAKVQTQAGLRDAYLEKRGEVSVIAYGHYDDPTSKQAKADVDRVKNLEVVVDGQKTKPFAQAFLSPPEDAPGSMPEYDLHNARKLSGDWALYTLQVGVYGRGDRKPSTPADLVEFRKAAEQAVVQLRREGEQAYYFHGPNMSMVTVGLFGKDDYDPQLRGVESATLRLLRQRYPYNLLNGMGTKHVTRIKDTSNDKELSRKEKLEPSTLVMVPKGEEKALAPRVPGR